MTSSRRRMKELGIKPTMSSFRYFKYWVFHPFKAYRIRANVLQGICSSRIMMEKRHYRWFNPHKPDRSCCEPVKE